MGMIARFGNGRRHGFFGLFLSLLLVGLIGVGCGQPAPDRRPTGAIPRAATVILPTPAPTLAPSPVSTRVMPLRVITRIPTDAVSPTPTSIPDEALGLVVGVLDGSTIRVVLEGDSMRHSYLVRYVGIEAPPNDEENPWGVVSYETNRKMTGMKVVRLVRDQTNFDEEGRLLRYVYVADRLMNTWLVEQGLARTNIATPDIRLKTEIEQAELQAQTAEVGIWSGQPPTPTVAPYPTTTVLTGTATLSPATVPGTVALPTATQTPTVSQSTATATATATVTTTPSPSPTTNPETDDLQGPE